MAAIDDIFAADPDAAPEERKSRYEDAKFRLYAGMQKEDGSAQGLPNWRFTSDSNETLERLAELYGGTLTEFKVKGVTDTHLITEAQDLNLIYSGPDAIDFSLILWGANGPLHKCDGFKILQGDDEGEPCGCPTAMADRIARGDAKPQKGPKPFIKHRFQLVDDTDLGTGEFIAYSWGAMKELVSLNKALAAVDGEALVKFSKEYVSFTNQVGKFIEYYKSAITVEGSLNDAVAEER